MKNWQSAIIHEHMNSSIMFYYKNAQGDVVALYRTDYNSSTQQNYGTLVCTYKYDPYGALLGVYDANGNATNDYDANLNPFRYRSYYYDTETGFYYLQSRYYDPQIGRFINADRYASTGQGILGQNMYVYCGNNPIMHMDSGGQLWTNIVVGAVIGAATSAITSLIHQDAEWAIHNIAKGAFMGALSASVAEVNGYLIFIDACLTFVELTNEPETSYLDILLGVSSAVLLPFCNFPYFPTELGVGTQAFFDATIGFGTTLVCTEVLPAIIESQTKDIANNSNSDNTPVDKGGNKGSANKAYRSSSGGGSPVSTRYNAFM